jgi:hypothetical protein
MLMRNPGILGRHRQIDVRRLPGGVPPTPDGDLVPGQLPLLLRGVRGQIEPRGLRPRTLHHRHEVVTVGPDRRQPGGRLLLIRGPSGRRLGGTGLRIAVATTLTGTARTAGATGPAGTTGTTRGSGRRRGDHPVVVTAAEGRAALLRTVRLLREPGRSRRRGLLERLRATARLTGPRGRGRAGGRRDRPGGVGAAEVRGPLRVRGVVAERSGRTLPLTTEGTGPTAAELVLPGAFVAELATAARGLLVAEGPGPTGRLVAEGRSRGTGRVVVAEGGPGRTGRIVGAEGVATLALAAEALRTRTTGTAALPVVAEALRTGTAGVTGSTGTAGPTLPVVAEALRAGTTGTTRSTGAALALTAEALRAGATRAALPLVAETLRTGTSRPTGPALSFATTETTGPVRTPRRTRSSGPPRRFAPEGGYGLRGPVHL